MADDTRVIDTGWDALPEYTDKPGEGDTVTVSLSTAPGEWLVNTTSSVVVPMSMAEVVEALRAGKLTERSLVWRQGMQEWQHVDAVPQLKLAARLSSPPPQQRARPPEKPTKPQAPPTATAPSARQSPLPHPGLSRRSTLPFGLPAPTQAAPVRPHVTKPILAEPDPAEDSDVLAVYARPAATISFDLSPEQPLRGPPPAPTPLPAPVRTTLVPQTLAPTTSDSSPSVHFSAADLSVVAAADFREVKRSGKRRVLGWSLASAAAASLLTFWLARSAPNAPVVAAARAPEAAAALPTTTPSPPHVAEKVEAAAAPVEPSAAPVASVAPPSEPPVAKAAAPKVRAPRKRRPVVAAVVDTESAPAEEPAASAPKEPSAEPNPYDMKGGDEPATKAPAGSGSGLEQASGDVSASTGSKSPGF